MDEFARRLSRPVVLTQISTNETIPVTGQFLLLHALLGEDTPTCIASRDLVMVYTQQWAGVYRSETIADDVPDEMVPILSRFFGKEGNIPILQREFHACQSKYFYIPMTLLPVVTTSPAHANGILVDRSTGTTYRIEPEGVQSQMSSRETLAVEAKINQGILAALREIGVANPSLYEFDITCPQAIAKDRNCIFWTAYMAWDILKQIDIKEPRETVRDLTANPPDIRAFKQDLETTLLPAFLEKMGVRWEMGGGMYWPLKYHRGLTRRQNLQRKRSATRRTKISFKNPKAYVPWKTDKGVNTRRSSYTSRFHKAYPKVKTLPEIAKATGISKSILQEVYNRGMAAWRTGHRPGASQHAWGMARVHSFVLHGKTWRTADSDLARKV